jgi:ribosomal-protein-alanine N-acetyltransferase
MIIQPATLSDLPMILAIEQASFPSPWTEDHFRYELKENPYAFLLVAKVDEQLIGYIDFWITFQQAQINNLAVTPGLRRKGIGKVLLEDALKRIQQAGCERVTLEVRVSNLAAQKLYEMYGFRFAYQKKQYYANGEDAWLMEKTL